MISPYRSPEMVFNDVASQWERSSAAEILEAAYQATVKGQGRPEEGIHYTLKAVLVAHQILLEHQTTPTQRAAVVLILFGFTTEQLNRLGMSIDPAERERLQDPQALDAEYRRHKAWLTRRLAPMDTNADMPAIRMTNAEYADRLKARTAADIEAAERAAAFGRDVCNAIVAASIQHPCPDGYEGDVVIDETIFDVAKPREGMGFRPDKKRAAVTIAGYYVREHGVVADGQTRSGKVDKKAYGVGVTTVIRAGAPGKIRRVTPLITAIDIHPPTSASVVGVRNALEQHRRNGFDPRPADGSRASNARAPYVAVDMGYVGKNGFAQTLIEHGYTMLTNYPRNWHLVSQTEDPPRMRGREEPGPIVAHGDIYCPASRPLLAGRMPGRTRDMDSAAIKAHDRRLRQLHPYRMGTNSRLKACTATPGRPRKDEERQLAYKVEVVCPAAQGRLRCPLKPASELLPTSEVPTAVPDWDVDYRCCTRAQTTITLTERQIKQYQGGKYPPGSWEHMHLLEAYRSLNERQFAFLKSPYSTGVQQLNFSARREPMVKLLIAMMAAVSNARLQERPKVRAIDSVTERWQKLERHLGNPPAKTPPRT